MDGTISNSVLSDEAKRFVLERASAIVGRRLAEIDLAPEVLRGMFHELSRAPELELQHRDSWGNWEFPYSIANLRGQLYTPWIDAPFQTLSGPKAMTSVWPEHRPFALCLTHDLDFITLQPSLSDCIRQIRRDVGLLLRRPRETSASAVVPRSLARSAYLITTFRCFRPRRERTYDEWIRLEAKYGFHSTFFVFPERVIDPHPYDCLYSYRDAVRYEGRAIRVDAMLKEMSAAGWEIGLHGSYRSATEDGLLRDQRGQVERMVGERVESTRQHWLHYRVDITPRLQAAAGLHQDSTQGFNRNVGFRAGTAFPYACWDHLNGTPFPVLEVPQHVMDGALFTTNALEYDVDLAVRHCIHLMDEVEKVGGCLTLSWHPNSLQYDHYWETYQLVLAEASRRRAWGCSVRELSVHWANRMKSVGIQPVWV